MRFRPPPDLRRFAPLALSPSSCGSAELFLKKSVDSPFFFEGLPPLSVERGESACPELWRVELSWRFFLEVSWKPHGLVEEEMGLPRKKMECWKMEQVFEDRLIAAGKRWLEGLRNSGSPLRRAAWGEVLPLLIAGKFLTGMEAGVRLDPEASRMVGERMVEILEDLEVLLREIQASLPAQDPEEEEAAQAILEDLRAELLKRRWRNGRLVD